MKKEQFQGNFNFKCTCQKLRKTDDRLSKDSPQEGDKAWREKNEKNNNNIDCNYSENILQAQNNHASLFEVRNTIILFEGKLW